MDIVPVVLHEGFSDDEIVGLADQDNENDEYHASVPIVDVWMEYRRLVDMGWQQRRIAVAKGVAESLVSDRLKYASWQPVMHKIFESDFLKEGHAREIEKISKFEDLSPWLTREEAMHEVLQSVIAAVRAKQRQIRKPADFVVEPVPPQNGDGKARDEVGAQLGVSYGTAYNAIQQVIHLDNVVLPPVNGRDGKTYPAQQRRHRSRTG